MPRTRVWTNGESVVHQLPPTAARCPKQNAPQYAAPDFSRHKEPDLACPVTARSGGDCYPDRTAKIVNRGSRDGALTKRLVRQRVPANETKSGSGTRNGGAESGDQREPLDVASASNGFRKKQMSTGLGGWQRLGIVVSTIWTLVVASIVWNNWPVLSDFTRSQIMSFGLLLWLMPPLAIAVVCRWVYQGFRLQRESPTEVVSPEKQRLRRPAEDSHPIKSRSSSATEVRSNIEKDPLVDQASSAAGCSEARRVTAKRCPSCGLLNHGAAEQCALCDNFGSGLATEVEGGAAAAASVPAPVKEVADLTAMRKTPLTVESVGLAAGAETQPR